MASSNKINIGISLLLLCAVGSVANASMTITVDADMRYHLDHRGKGEAKAEAVGISLRKVFADTYGDRVIFFTVVDAMDNFREVMVDQGYVQYKGPMGKWNVTLGRYIVPFGLLPNYSTKRLLIKTQEYETVGLNSDTGLQISGVLKDFDYALSFSQGIGTNRWFNNGREFLVTARISHEGLDFEDWKIGLSGLWGKVLPDQSHGGHRNMSHMPVRKNLFAVDLIKYHGLAVMRAEASVGEEEKHFLNGIFLGVDYAILPKTDLNFAYTRLQKNTQSQDVVTTGFTYNWFGGFQIRAAHSFSLGGSHDVSSFQIYNIITRNF